MTPNLMIANLASNKECAAESRLSTCGKWLAFLNCYRMAATQAGCKFYFKGLGARHSKEKAIKYKIFIRIPVY